MQAQHSAQQYPVGTGDHNRHDSWPMGLQPSIGSAVVLETCWAILPLTTAGVLEDATRECKGNIGGTGTLGDTGSCHTDECFAHSPSYPHNHPRPPYPP